MDLEETKNIFQDSNDLPRIIKHPEIEARDGEEWPSVFDMTIERQIGHQKLSEFRDRGESQKVTSNTPAAPLVRRFAPFIRVNDTSAVLPTGKSGGHYWTPIKLTTTVSQADTFPSQPEATRAVWEELEEYGSSSTTGSEHHHVEDTTRIKTSVPSRIKTEAWWKYRTARHTSRFSSVQSEPELIVPFSDKLKSAVEAYIDSNVLWWPLRSIGSRPNLSEDQVSWKCSCGAHFSLCVNYLFNLEVIDQLMSNTVYNPGNTPILPVHRTQGLGVASGVSQQPSISAGSQSSSSSVRQRSETSFSSASTETQNGGSICTNSGIARKYLHWCVNSHRAITKLVELEAERLTEKSLVATLLAAYNAARGVYSWLTLTSCTGVKFVKFRKLAVKAEYVTYLKDELPCRKTNREYQYEYCDDPTTPEADFVKWLQAVIAVRIAYPNCPETLALCNALDYIPKKVNGKMRTLDGYGMHAISAYCLWKAVLAVFIASIPSGVFMVRWLVGHRGDWQNALGLLAVTYSLLNILVLQHDRWSMETIR